MRMKSKSQSRLARVEGCKYSPKAGGQYVSGQRSVDAVLVVYFVCRCHLAREGGTASIIKTEPGFNRHLPRRSLTTYHRPLTTSSSNASHRSHRRRPSRTTACPHSRGAFG